MLAAASAVVYLAGTPLGTLLVLFRNSRRQHAPEIESRFGDLYCQYEDRRPYWVVVLMLQKMCLTGGHVRDHPRQPHPAAGGAVHLPGLPGAARLRRAVQGHLVRPGGVFGQPGADTEPGAGVCARYLRSSGLGDTGAVNSESQ